MVKQTVVMQSVCNTGTMSHRVWAAAPCFLTAAELTALSWLQITKVVGKQFGMKVIRQPKFKMHEMENLNCAFK
jgi:hypothetical protein